MKALALLLALSVCAAGADAACDMAPAERPASVTAYGALVEACLATPPGDAFFDGATEATFLGAVNAARAEAGLAPLAWRSELLPAARFHSLDQLWNGVFGHTGSEGRSASDRIAALDRTLLRSFSAENVAMASGNYDPATVPAILHAGLMDSPGHRANILHESATHIAIGVTRRRDEWVVTQVFARRAGVLEAALPTRIDPRNLPGFAAGLDDWTVHGAVFQMPGREDYLAVEALAGAGTGRVHSFIEGRRALEDRRGYRYMYVPGPDVDLAPALRR